MNNNCQHTDAEIQRLQAELAEETKWAKHYRAEAERLTERVGVLEKCVITAYECGHNDTVESNCCDPIERCAEIIEEALEDSDE